MGHCGSKRQQQQLTSGWKRQACARAQAGGGVGGWGGGVVACCTFTRFRRLIVLTCAKMGQRASTGILAYLLCSSCGVF